MYFNKLLITALLVLVAPNAVNAKPAIKTERKEIAPIVSSSSKIEKTTNKKTVKEWDAIFEDAKKSVVQVFCYSGSFDCFRPYKTPSHQLGCGSGFFIDKDGYLLTNFHVITNALAIFIQLPQTGKEQFMVEIVGVHPLRDLALLKLTDQDHQKLKQQLNVKTLPYMPLIENSDTLKETQEIMLAGYPLGDENIKASLGECSGREYNAKYGNVIQTTVPTNNGNSGGPYFNKYGEIVGVCAFGMVGIGVEGVNYFIPSNTVKMVLPDLLNKTIVSNPFWGWNLIPTTEHTNAYLGCPLDGGIYIATVNKGSLAAMYGFMKGDVLYRVNNLLIDHYGCVQPEDLQTKIDFSDYLSRFALGETVGIEFYREGTQTTVGITLQEPEEIKTNLFCPFLEKPFDFEIIGGLVFVQLTLNHLCALEGRASAINKYLEFNERVNAHVLIADTFPSSPAAKARCLYNGDWFVNKINGFSVSTIPELRAAIVAGKERDYLTIETDAGSLVVLSIKEILQEEPRLIQQYLYPKSSLIDVLAQAQESR